MDEISFAKESTRNSWNSTQSVKSVLEVILSDWKKKNGEEYEPESLKGIKKNPVWIDIFLAKSIDIALLVQTNLNPVGRF